MILHIPRTAILGLLLLSTLALQGCLGIVWLGTVGIDVTRTSDIEFQSFENSWELAPQERQHLGLVKPVRRDPVWDSRPGADGAGAADERGV